jgi:hypothetical protein
MRVVSKFKDYYDGVMAHGMDINQRYIRDDREDILIDGLPTIQPPATGFKKITHIIGFCGKLYPVIEMYPAGIQSSLESYRGLEKHGRTLRPEFMLHDADAVERFMKINLQDEGFDFFLTGKRKKRKAWGSLHWGKENTRENWDEYFNWFKRDLKPNEQAIFDSSKAPIFVVADDHKLPDPNNSSYWAKKQGIVYNCPLKIFNFAKVKDPYQTFQDIRMWLSNQAFPNPPMIQMSNEDTAARLGHGDPYSFRKPPSKKR